MALRPRGWLFVVCSLVLVACKGPPAPPVAAATPAPPLDISALVAQAIASPVPPLPPPPQQLSVTLDGCDSADCEVVLRFSHPVAARPPAAFEPRLKGKWRWESPTHVVFHPTKVFEPGASVLVKITALPAEVEGVLPIAEWSKHLVLAPAMVAGKVIEWPVFKGKPRLVTSLTSGDRFGPSGLLLVFDQPVEPANLARTITVRSKDGPLKFKLEPVDSVEPMYDGALDLRLVVRLKLSKLPEHGQKVEVTLPSWQEGARGRPEVTTEAREFQVSSTLVLAPSGFEDNQRVPLSSTFEFVASNPLDESTVQPAISIEPRPVSMNVEAGWQGPTVTMELSPGVKYRLVLDGVTDLFGNRAPKQVVKFRAQDLAPKLDAPLLPVVVERQSPRLPVQALNLGPLTAEVSRYESMSDFLVASQATGPRTCPSPLLKSMRVVPKAKLNEATTLEVPLDGLAGLLCVDLWASGSGSEANPLRTTAVMQISNLSATVKLGSSQTLVWVTHLSDASPAARAKVSVLDDKGTIVARATADDDGIAVLPLATKDRKLFVWVQERNDFAVTPLDEERLSKASQFGIQGEVPGASRLSASLFTERGVYRPGEKVNLKAIVGGAGKVSLHVADPRGQAVLTQTLTLDALGTTQSVLTLNEKATVGEYTVRLTRAGSSTTRKFRVEEYRVPTFSVAVSAASDWTSGAEAKGSIQARYLHGSAMSGREVKWELFAEPAHFTPAGFADYLFALEGSARSGVVDQGEAKLDGDGRLAVVFKPQLRDDATRYTLEATVTDVDRQASTGRQSRVVHPGTFYVGLKPPAKKVLSVGDVVEVPVVSLNVDGRVRSAVAVEVALENIEHHVSARLAGTHDVEYSNQPVVGGTEKCRVVTAAAPVVCRFKLAQAGRYHVSATALDGARTLKTGFELTVAGDTGVAWPRFDQDRIDVVADRAAYKVGDTAKLVVQTPFETASGLLTVESGGVLTHRRFEIRKDTPALEVPITSQMVPNAFVSVVLLRGRTHAAKDAVGFETGAPAFKLGYAELNVDPSAVRLLVQVKPSATVVAPKGTIALEVQVKDASGAPVQGAVALAVVDEAVLGLTQHRTPDPISELYAARPLGVRTADGRLDLIHARRSRREALFPGGDGSDGLGLRILPDQLRNLFQSTAYWNPGVPVGADGFARVTFTVPDNLTTFRVMAIAWDGKGRAGSSDAQVVVRKPLMVQPVAPRFVYPGDRFTVEAVVFNGASEQREIDLGAFSLEGLTPKQGAPLATRVTLKAGGSAKFAIPVTVTGRGKVKIRWRAQTGPATDEVEVVLPILDAGAKQVTVASTQVNVGSGALELEIPADRLAHSTEVEVMVSSSALSELKGAVEHLMHYPNGCIEQTTSNAYPLVVLKDLLPDMGVEVNAEDLKKFSEAGVKRLLSFQTASGGLSYWPGGDKPHAFGTTFGLTALIEAKKRGYDVPDVALKRAADWLEATLKQGSISEEMPHEAMPDGDTRALMVLTLNRLGRPQPAYVSTLWRERTHLSAFGLAMLATTVSEGGADKSLLEPMLAEVRKQSTESGTEAWYDGRRAEGWSMGSPLRTHAAALLAFGSKGVQSDAAGKLLTGLLKRRTSYGIWGNTQEDVYGIMAVSQLVGARSTPGASPEAKLTIGARQLTMGQLEKVSERVRRFTAHGQELGLVEGKPGVAKISLDRAQGGPATFLTMRLRYELPLVGKHRDARASGFQISRRYEALDGKPLEGRSIPLGSVVRVRVLVNSPEKRNYVAIDDKLPAGLEPLNAHLATTERVSVGPSTPELEKGLQLLSFSETRDARVAFFVDEMPAGRTEYVYLARATTPGHFLRPPASVEAMYEPQVMGSSAIDEIDIVPAAAQGRAPRKGR